MTSSTISLPTRPRTLPAAVLALFGALLLALWMVPGPAHAHDTLISTDPEDGASLETSPEQITLTYSAEILDVSPLVRITDEAGETVAEIVPSIEGPDAIVTFEEPLPSGSYEIAWRVVSSDGHPIEGILSITVEQDSAPAASDTDGADDGTADDAVEGGAESESATEEPAAPADPAEPEESTDAAAEETSDSSGSPTLLIVIAIVVVAALGVVLAMVFTRRPAKHADGSGGDGDDADPKG